MTTPPRVRFPLTVFYDASCRLCAGEMESLKRRDAHGRLELVDCSAPDFDEAVLAGLPIRRKDLMARIHARDAHGRWFVGVQVFEIACGAVGRDAMAGIWGNRALRPALERIYPWIARHRQLLSKIGLPK
jgi:predicted DCC family thiol-disulfide oxidoreductase YuxK